MGNVCVVTKNGCSNGNRRLATDTTVNRATNFIKNALTMSLTSRLSILTGWSHRRQMARNNFRSTPCTTDKNCSTGPFFTGLQNGTGGTDYPRVPTTEEEHRRINKTVRTITIQC